MFKFDSREGVTQRIIERLNRAGLSATTSGSFIRTLADVFADEGVNIYSDLNFFAQQAFVDTASGPFLDLIGNGLYGIPRLQAKAAEATADDSAVELYVESGYLYDYLPKSGDGLTALIAAGTNVFSTGGQAFQVTEDVIVPPGVTSVYIGITGVLPGQSGSVPPGAITTIELEAPVKVRNNISVTGGTSEETDNEYRFRLTQAYTSLEKANETAIRVALLQVQGIADVILTNNLHGPGTFEVLLIPEGNRVTPSQIIEAQRVLNDVVAYTHTAFIREPKYVFVRVDVKVDPVNPGTDNGALRATVASAITRYLESIELGGTLVVNQILAAAMNVSGVRDAELINVCLDNLPLLSGQYQLGRRELISPSLDQTESVRVIV